MQLVELLLQNRQERNYWTAYSEMLLLIFNQMEEEVEYQPILQKQTVMVGTIDYREL